jgi:hypothetical protein
VLLISLDALSRGDEVKIDVRSTQAELPCSARRSIVEECQRRKCRAPSISGQLIVTHRPEQSDFRLSSYVLSQLFFGSQEICTRPQQPLWSETR